MTIKKRTITNFINNEYKGYAIHTLTSRGIPNFYDSLTPIQRIILLNSPITNSKTLSVVGNCISDDYHSGDSSLSKCINRLARPYDCAETLLIGDGFFGNQITQEAASSRYTSVKINPTVYESINKFKFLNKKDDDGSYKPIGIDLPLGLLLPTIGIAVGYSTIILPRSLKDIQKFLNGKIKELKPSFKDFEGSIEKYNNLDNSWLLKGNVEIIENKKTINILSIPPMMKYQSFIKKIEKILLDVDCVIHNNSKSFINISIQLSNKIDSDVWSYVKEKIENATKLIIKENIIFIKDKVVLEYDSVENYLEDFKTKNEYLYLEAIVFNINENTEELKYLEAKLEYLTWFLKESKLKNLTQKNIDDFLNSYPTNISKKLEDIRLKVLNSNELERVNLKIDEFKKLINFDTLERKKRESYIKTMSNKLHIKDKKITSLYEGELNNIDNIEIYNDTLINEAMEDIKEEIDDFTEHS